MVASIRSLPKNYGFKRVPCCKTCGQVVQEPYIVLTRGQRLMYDTIRNRDVFSYLEISNITKIGLVSIKVLVSSLRTRLKNSDFDLPCQPSRCPKSPFKIVDRKTGKLARNVTNLTNVTPFVQRFK